MSDELKSMRRRIAELEAENAQLKKRPVLEADVLASFSAFDANGDGHLTKDEVVAMLTRKTAGGYAMTREAAEAKWNEWVQRHDANSDGKLSYKEIAAGISHAPRKPAYMDAVKKTVKDFPFLELAGGAFAIASKVSKEVYEVDTLYGILMRGEAKIGAGTTARAPSTSASTRTTRSTGRAPRPGRAARTTSASTRTARGTGRAPSPTRTAASTSASTRTRRGTASASSPTRTARATTTASG